MNFNIKYYPWYSASTSAMAWLPIFFLYFNEHLSMSEVILLESIYYFSVVILEVPSGYFSDMFGRKITLLLSTLFFIFSYLLFGIGGGYGIFIVAQILLAGGMSFRSGSNSSFLYESLEASGRASEYGDHEARVQKISLISGGVAVILGGILGSYHLSWGYWASLLFAIPGCIIVLGFTENNSYGAKRTIIGQLNKVAIYLKEPILSWLMVYSIIIFILVHIPYEFYQGYLELLEERGDFVLIDAAITSGILFGITRFIGAIAASKSMVWRNKFGLKKMLMMAGIIQLVILICMGWILHSLVILMILFRNFSFALTTAPIYAAIAPKVDAEQRATYFSIQSLFSRLGFALVLVLFSKILGYNAPNTWENLSLIFISTSVVGFILLFLLFLVPAVYKINGEQENQVMGTSKYS